MQHRFPVRVELSDRDVEQVVREVVLRKQPNHVDDVRQVLEAARAKSTANWQVPRSARTTADENDLVPDYPLLPARRRFWDAYCVLSTAPVPQHNYAPNCASSSRPHARSLKTPWVPS